MSSALMGGDITAPFDSRDHIPDAAIIHDPSAQIGTVLPHPFEDPAQRSFQHFRRQSYTGWVTQEIDIEQHEMLLGGSIELAVGNRLNLGVLAGVTLSYVDWTFKADAWFVNDAGQTVEPRKFSRSGKEWLWGATCQVQARWDLTEDGRYFLVLDGGYNWVDDFSVRNEISSAKVRLESWVASGAVGRRL